jgi:hypothetical protein
MYFFLEKERDVVFLSSSLRKSLEDPLTEAIHPPYSFVGSPWDHSNWDDHNGNAKVEFDMWS